MHKEAHLFFIGTMLLAAAAAGCGDSNSSGSGGTGGSGTTSSGGGGSTGNGGSTGGATSTGGTTSTGGQGGAGGATSSFMCPEDGNPLFGSCIETFLKGCYEPDLNGTCTQDNGTTTWSDGSKYVTSGAMPGLYGPGDATPCITIAIDQNKITATKGNETLVYDSDGATMTATVTCPDGSQLTASFDQVTHFNQCVGVNCPP